MDVWRLGLGQMGLVMSSQERLDDGSGEEVLDHRRGAPNETDTMLGWD